MKFVMTLVSVLLLTSITSGQQYPNELEAVSAIAEKYNAQEEVKLWDHTRVDLLSATHAYEVDWSHKYAEGVGQALYYGVLTNRQPSLILLVRDINKEQRFVYRAQIACQAADVELHLEIVAPAVKSQAAIGQQNPLTDEDDPIYVYFIYDPEGDTWYKRNTFGLTGWGKQMESEVWTVKKTAERALASMYGSRANRCVLKKFILIPAKDNK